MVAVFMEPEEYSAACAPGLCYAGVLLVCKHLLWLTELPQLHRETCLTTGEDETCWREMSPSVRDPCVYFPFFLKEKKKNLSLYSWGNLTKYFVIIQNLLMAPKSAKEDLYFGLKYNI